VSFPPYRNRNASRARATVRETDGLLPIVTNFGTGTVHLGSRIVRFPGMMALGCTGRAVDGALGTDQAVTCKSCRRVFAGSELLGPPPTPPPAAPYVPPGFERSARDEALLQSWKRS
jgi:hypothetical protein